MAKQQPSVLVVDDDEDICSNVTDILDDLGCRTDTASYGEEALGLVDRMHTTLR